MAEAIHMHTNKVTTKITADRRNLPKLCFFAGADDAIRIYFEYSNRYSLFDQTFDLNLISIVFQSEAAS